VPWEAERPNAGFMLLAGEEIVGANLAFYSERTIDGRRERFCNLGAWCVLEGHRLHALKPLKALLAQEGYHFTDLSPSGSVVAVNERLGFRFVETDTLVVPNLPWPTRRRCTISSDPATIEATLEGSDLQLYRDHAAAPAARHLVLIRGDRSCYVVFRKDRRKGLPLFASLLYVSDPALLHELRGPLVRHLLLRHGALATLAEERALPRVPRLSLRLGRHRPKMLRSSSIEPDRIDYLYSELVCVPW
jgi:hypothetical protein